MQFFSHIISKRRTNNIPPTIVMNKVTHDRDDVNHQHDCPLPFGKEKKQKVCFVTRTIDKPICDTGTQPYRRELF